MECQRVCVCRWVGVDMGVFMHVWERFGMECQCVCVCVCLYMCVWGGTL
jgi:hypothetical protein